MLGFSRLKPVFPVQNGINWDKPVFPSLSHPKLGKSVQNWEKLCRTTFTTSKSCQKWYVSNNKANLRDLIAATGLVISNWIQIVIFFRLCDREILWMTSKNNRTLLLYYVKLCASFPIHWWIQTGFTFKKRSIRVKFGDMLSRVTLKFDRWPWKTIGHLFYATSSFVHHFVAIGEFKLELQSGNTQSGSKSTIFLAMWPRNFTDDPQKQ